MKRKRKAVYGICVVLKVVIKGCLNKKTFYSFALIYSHWFIDAIIQRLYCHVHNSFSVDNESPRLVQEYNIVFNI